MKVSVQVIVHPDDAEDSAVVREVFALDRDGLAPDTLGLQLAEAKDLLVAVQDSLVDTPGQRRDHQAGALPALREASPAQGHPRDRGAHPCSARCACPAPAGGTAAAATSAVEPSSPLPSCWASGPLRSWPTCRPASPGWYKKYAQGTLGIFLIRERGRGLGACGQADIDAWYADAYTAHRLTHTFLRWSIRNQLLTPVTIPHQNTTNPTPISQTQRLATIRRLLTEDDIPLLTRLAATLMLLYAQPLTRILRLRIDDVLHQDNEVSIRLGDPPTPLPEPFARLLDKHIDHRLNLTTATNPDARWLFPGRRSGQPMTPDVVERRLRQHEIPALNGRTAALRQLVLQAPAPVVATMLGYNPDHTTRLVTEVGGTWTRYAAGDHTR